MSAINITILEEDVISLILDYCKNRHLQRSPGVEESTNGANNNERLIQLLIRGVVFESCVNFFAAKSKSCQDKAQVEMSPSDLLIGSGSFGHSDKEFFSWIQSLPMEAFNVPTAHSSLNVNLERLEDQLRKVSRMPDPEMDSTCEPIIKSLELMTLSTGDVMHSTPNVSKKSTRMEVQSGSPTKGTRKSPALSPTKEFPWADTNKPPMSNDLFMQNGFMYDPICLNSETVQVVNTCGFDSFTEILKNGYTNYVQFQNFVDSNLAEPTFKYVKDYANEGTNVALQIRRGEILNKFYPVKEEKEGKVLNAFDSVNEFLGRLLAKYPGVTFIEDGEEHNCAVIELCDYRSVKNFSFDALFQHCFEAFVGLKQLQRTNQLLVIDVGIVGQVHKRENSRDTCLNDLPSELYLNFQEQEWQQEHFKLIGAIAYDNMKKHFTAMSRRPTGEWTQYDDLIAEPCQIADPSKVHKTFTTLIFLKTSAAESFSQKGTSQLESENESLVMTVNNTPTADLLPAQKLKEDLPKGEETPVLMECEVDEQPKKLAKKVEELAALAIPNSNVVVQEKFETPKKSEENGQLNESLFLGRKASASSDVSETTEEESSERPKRATRKTAAQLPETSLRRTRASSKVAPSPTQTTMPIRRTRANTNLNFVKEDDPIPSAPRWICPEPDCGASILLANKNCIKRHQKVDCKAARKGFVEGSYCLFCAKFMREKEKMIRHMKTSDCLKPFKENHPDRPSARNKYFKSVSTPEELQSLKDEIQRRKLSSNACSQGQKGRPQGRPRGRPPAATLTKEKPSESSRRTPLPAPRILPTRKAKEAALNASSSSTPVKSRRHVSRVPSEFVITELSPDTTTKATKELVAKRSTRRTKAKRLDDTVSSEEEQQESHKVSSFLDNEAYSEGDNGDKPLNSDIEREDNLNGKDLTSERSESENSHSHNDGSDLKGSRSDKEEEEGQSSNHETSKKQSKAVKKIKRHRDQQESDSDVASFVTSNINPQPISQSQKSNESFSSLGEKPQENGQLDESLSKESKKKAKKESNEANSSMKQTNKSVVVKEVMVALNELTVEKKKKQKSEGTPTIDELEERPTENKKKMVDKLAAPTIVNSTKIDPETVKKMKRHRDQQESDADGANPVTSNINPPPPITQASQKSNESLPSLGEKSQETTTRGKKRKNSEETPAVGKEPAKHIKINNLEGSTNTNSTNSIVIDGAGPSYYHHCTIIHIHQDSKEKEN